MDTLPVEEVKVDLEEQIQYFPGYENPFWYEQKKNIAFWKSMEIDACNRLEAEKKRPNTISAGTQPDIEIRWRYH